MRRGLLPYCVLAMLRDTERYGFELVQALGSVDGTVTVRARSTLLSRLPGRVGRHHVAESTAGPPRRYHEAYRGYPTALRLHRPTRSGIASTPSGRLQADVGR
jgi:PadR family transcriptional regulator PadR